MLAKEDHLIILGRGLCLPAAKEIALKIEEICYIFTKSLMSAELKHGPISLITREEVDMIENGRIVRVEKRTPIISLSPISDSASNATKHQVIARGANLIDITDTNESELTVPSSNDIEFGLGSVVLGQMLSYYTALERGCNVDKPRNLAKSVTVI
jgi:glucosamine--fructose-6-phosphate aminotransferase (isomerizing)